MGIADRLIQMLMNLLINAADACAALPARTGQVVIETRRVPGGVELTVTDNGSGMPGDVLARAFEPLFTTKPAGVGTGLGLSQCRSIVQDDHGGAIELESAPGEGARVRVRLPVEEEKVAALQ
jgi:signal transduction histidine kinase